MKLKQFSLLLDVQIILQKEYFQRISVIKKA